MLIRFLVMTGLFLGSFFYGNLQSFAADLKESDSAFEYPELMVTPKASERLQLEAKSEKSQALTVHIPIQLSGLITAMAGVMALDDNGRGKDPDPNAAKYAGITGLTVGLGWILITGTMSSMYKPYTVGNNAIKALPSKTKAEQLTRERLAEEYLRKPSSLASKLNFLSIVSNLGANAYILAASKDETTNVVAGLGILAAFGPLLFNYYWHDVYNNHEEYKKKIYGPVSSSTILFEEKDNKIKAIPAITTAIAF